MTEMPNLPAVDYCCSFDPQDTDMGCMCGASERVLRAVRLGKIGLTGEQREWCYCEIDRVEGHNRNQFLTEDDATVANGVLSAWTDYCRDKGLI